MKHILIFLLVLAACTHGPVKRAPSSERAKHLGPEVTPILIWNTLKGKRADFLKDARELIEAHEIVLFQEVRFRDFFLELLRNEGRLSVERSISWGDNGVATASVSASHDTLPIRTKVREFGFFTRKASLFTTYKIQTPDGELRDLLVLNVHMINFRTSWGFQKNLERYREKIENHQGPVLAAGDFNTWSNPRRELVQEFFHQFGMKEVEFDRGNFRDPRAKSIFGVLDRTFTRGLQVHWAHVFDDIQSSDHSPFALGVTAHP